MPFHTEEEKSKKKKRLRKKAKKTVKQFKKNRLQVELRRKDSNMSISGVDGDTQRQLKRDSTMGLVVSVGSSQ